MPIRRSKLTQLHAAQYDALERAIADGRRLSVWRRGTEFMIIVDRLRVTGGREALQAHHPTTGDKLLLYICELEGIEVISWARPTRRCWRRRKVSFPSWRSMRMSRVSATGAR